MPAPDENYLQVLSELENWGNYEISAKPRDISKLDAIQRLLKDLGNPQQNFKIIHIAGTNGKGLTATILSNLLILQGFTTGCYTSPHLKDIRERIILNSELVSKDSFAQSASIVLKIARSYKGNPYLSYFDVLTAIAFHAFMSEKMEWIVMETGLGGKADSTNVTEKELCILSKVGLDHQEVLGNNLQQIAVEKIGITRPKIPIVVAEQVGELKLWLTEQFRKTKVPAYFTEDYFTEEFPITDFSFEYSSIPQLACIQTSLCAMQVLFDGSTLQKQKWLNAAKTVKLPGRLDLRKNIFWNKKDQYLKSLLLDGGHNQDALTALAGYLSTNKLAPYTLILGMASDKLADSLHTPLLELCMKAEQIIFTPVPSPRTSTPEMLENFIFASETSNILPEIKQTSSAEEALEVALNRKNSSIVVAGSFYLVGEVMQILENSCDS